MRFLVRFELSLVSTIAWIVTLNVRPARASAPDLAYRRTSKIPLMPSNLGTPSSNAEIMCHQGGDCLEKLSVGAATLARNTWRRLSALSPSTFPTHPNRSDPNSDSDTDASVDVYKCHGAANVANGNPPQRTFCKLPIYTRIGGMIAMGQQRWLRVACVAAGEACFVVAQLVSAAGGQGSICGDRVCAVNKSYQLAEMVLRTQLNKITNQIQAILLNAMHIDKLIGWVPSILNTAMDYGILITYRIARKCKRWTRDIQVDMRWFYC